MVLLMERDPKRDIAFTLKLDLSVPQWAQLATCGEKEEEQEEK